LNRNLRSGVLVFFGVPAQSLYRIDESGHHARGATGHGSRLILTPPRCPIVIQNAQMEDVGTGRRSIRLTKLHELRPFKSGELTNRDRHALHLEGQAAKLGQCQQRITHMSVTAPLIFSVKRAMDFSPGVPPIDQARTMAVNWKPNAGDEVGTMMRNVISVSLS
jgi:hypothetical protein